MAVAGNTPEVDGEGHGIGHGIDVEASVDGGHTHPSVRRATAAAHRVRQSFPAE